MSTGEVQQRDLPPVSDAGAIAARRGYKYQDHVAAHFVLRMISDPEVVQIECETADDIVLLWREVHGARPEYVQVKTIDADRKWSQIEICARPIAGQPTSLIEKSLLCDSGSGGARFRIVTQRGVNKSLLCLEAEFERRRGNSDVEALGCRLAKKFATKSANGNDLSYWAENTVWQVTGAMDALAARNEQLLAKLAEQYGANPTHSQTITIYEDLLKWVDKAALASRVTSPEDKILTRARVIAWWGEHLAGTAAAQRRTSKPYRVRTEPFFAELHHVNEEDIRRALSGYDARFELGRWRSQELAEYLADWLPEIALKASELVEVQHLNMRRKLRQAVQEISRHREIDHPRLLAEILLHAVLRHHFGSEPIACKLFYKTAEGGRTFGNAHIIHRQEGDELWLGRSALCAGSTYEQVLNTVLAELERVLDPHFLKEEREVIVTLREPHHLLPTSLERALERHTPIDDLLDTLCICMLIGYDSEVLGRGFAQDYRDKLIKEITARYDTIKPRLPKSVGTVKVHMFLVPIECASTLTGQFSEKIRGE